MQLRPAAALLLSSLAVAASAALAPSADAVRPLAVGTKAPDALVRTVSGEETRLGSVLQTKPTVLIFYRGGWCPFCNKHLAELAETEPALRELGYQIVALSPDGPAALQASTAKLRLAYSLYSDRGMAAAGAYGVAFRVPAATVAKYRDYQVDLPPVAGEPEARWLPVPAVFLIDRQGTIRFVHADADYRTRLSADALLAAARQTRE